MNKLTALILFCTIVVTVVSCAKKNITIEPIVSSTPLQALINSDTSLSIYYAAVKKANDNALYAGTDSAIVLIPVDSAFAAKGISVATINAMSAAAADSLLRYYYIPAPVTLAPGVYQAYATKLGIPLYGYGAIDSSGVYFSGISAAYFKLPGSNATVYKLSAPLQRPAASAAQLIATDSLLTYFAQALMHTSLNIVPATGTNTVLAPVNTAFIAAGYPTLASIDNADITALTDILRYHILPGQYFTNTLAGLTTLPTLQGSNISIGLTDGALQITGTGNSNAASLIKANRLAGSSVVLHEINTILMP